MSNQANWALFISSYAVTSTIFGSAIFYIFRHAVRKILAEEIKGIRIPLSQLESNGGKSVKDMVEITLANVEALRVELATQTSRLNQHIATTR